MPVLLVLCTDVEVVETAAGYDVGVGTELLLRDELGKLLRPKMMSELSCGNCPWTKKLF